MKFGILRSGFTLHNHVYRVEIPKGTPVAAGFDRDTRLPTVWFQGLDIRLIKFEGRFYAEVYGVLMVLEPFSPRIPYPASLIA